MRTTQQVYKMLENESLWQTAVRVHELLQQAEIPHALLGGVAVCLHGYQGNTVDVDVLVRREDTPVIRQALETEFTWDADHVEFRSPAALAAPFLYAGERAGSGSEVYLPDPAGHHTSSSSLCGITPVSTMTCKSRGTTLHVV